MIHCDPEPQSHNIRILVSNMAAPPSRYIDSDGSTEITAGKTGQRRSYENKHGTWINGKLSTSDTLQSYFVLTFILQLSFPTLPKTRSDNAPRVNPVSAAFSYRSYGSSFAASSPETYKSQHIPYIKSQLLHYIMVYFLLITVQTLISCVILHWTSLYDS